MVEKEHVSLENLGSGVFRLRPGPMLSLHEADGGLWRLQAIQSIKAYLEQAMVDIGLTIPVIA